MPTTLGAVEQEVARRCGPFESYGAAGLGGGTTVSVLGLRSSIDLGGYEDRWLLRRGAMLDGSPVVGFAVGDRQRRVASMDAAAGTLTVDRPYAHPVQADEALELLVLDPAQELRPAVLAGLGRCFFVERAEVALGSAAIERTLSGSLPWLTDPAQLRDVSVRVGGSAYLPSALPWYRSYGTGGGVRVAAAPDPYPDGLVVEALRPHRSWVNGADSTTGPTADADALACDLDYAAAAGHVEAWRLVRHRLAGPARAGLIPTQAEAVGEFNRQRAIHVPARPDRLGARYQPGGGGVLTASWDGSRFWDGLSAWG